MDALPNRRNLLAAEMDDHFKCGVCLDLLVRPVQCSAGHTACKKCVANVSECPTCRVMFGFGSNRIPNIVVQQMIDKLACRCPHGVRNEGEAAPPRKRTRSGGAESSSSSSSGGGEVELCAWEGTIGALEEHLKVCRHEEVACPFAAHGCAVALPRAEMEVHVAAAQQAHIVLLGAKLAALEKADTKLGIEIASLRQQAATYNKTTDEKIDNLVSSGSCKVRWIIQDVHAKVADKMQGHKSRTFKVVVPGLGIYFMNLYVNFGPPTADGKEQAGKIMSLFVQHVTSGGGSQILPITLDGTELSLYANDDSQRTMELGGTDMITKAGTSWGHALFHDDVSALEVNTIEIRGVVKISSRINDDEEVVI
jgi:hypothetical protein